MFHGLFHSSMEKYSMTEPGHMRRDMDLCRAILFELERASPLGLKTVTIDGHSDEEVSYHLYLLHNGGLIEGKDASGINHYKWFAIRITWGGQQFLSAIRDNGVWSTMKSKLGDKLGSLPFTVIASLATEVATKWAKQ